MLTFLPIQLKIAIQLLASGVACFLQIYTVLLTFRLYCSWFPNINMYHQPFATIGTATDFYLRFWRSWMPPQLVIDTSPIFAFCVLDFVTDFLSKIGEGRFLY